jgi:putative alpha-1,2-mannosidase
MQNHYHLQKVLSIPIIFTNAVDTFFADRLTNDAAVMLRFSRLAAGEQLLVRMGVSFISPSQACSNAEEEIPTYDFEAVSQSSISQFETILNRIRVDPTNVSNDTLTLFYSSVSASLRSS